jgi:hypothetical protein
MALDLSPGQARVSGYLNDSMAISTNVTNTLNTVISSMPFSVYFLSFLNYFTMSSLYALLNLPIPEQTYRHLSELYKDVSVNIFELLGISFELPPLSYERVDSSRALYYMISSDFTTNNIVGFIFLVCNMALILLLTLLASCLRKDNFIRWLFVHKKWECIYGQLINMMCPLVLPWAFIILQSGTRNARAKINTVAYLAVFFVMLFFPFYYFLSLLQERKRYLIIKMEQKNI